MAFFKMKSELPQDGSTRKIKILEDKGVQAEDQWGNISHRYEISVDDKDTFTWDASPTAMTNLQEIQADASGAVFVIKRWDKNGKTGFNYFPPEDVNVLPHNNIQPPPQDTPVSPKAAAPDDFQQKVSRGASLNLSSYHSIYEACGGKLKIDEWFKKVMVGAEEVASKQAAFVNDGKVTIEDLPFS